MIIFTSTIVTIINIIIGTVSWNVLNGTTTTVTTTIMIQKNGWMTQHSTCECSHIRFIVGTVPFSNNKSFLNLFSFVQKPKCSFCQVPFFSLLFASSLCDAVPCCAVLCCVGPHKCVSHNKLQQCRVHSQGTNYIVNVTVAFEDWSESELDGRVRVSSCAPAQWMRNERPEKQRHSAIKPHWAWLCVREKDERGVIISSEEKKKCFLSFLLRFLFFISHCLIFSRLCSNDETSRRTNGRVGQHTTHYSLYAPAIRKSHSKAEYWLNTQDKQCYSDKNGCVHNVTVEI